MLAGALPKQQALRQQQQQFQQGPASAYYKSLLMRPVQIAPPNPAGAAGWGGGLDSAVNIFTNFIQGIAEGRRNRIAEIESDRENKLQILQQRLQQVEQSDLVPEAKNEFRSQILETMQKIALGEDVDKPKKKSSIQNFLDMIADIFGQKMPKPAPDVLDFSAGIDQRMKQAPTVNQIVLDAHSDYAKAVEDATLRDDDGNVIGVSRARLAASPNFQSAVRKLASAGIYQVPQAWHEQIGTFISPDDEVKLSRRIAAGRFEKKAAEIMRLWEEQRMRQMGQRQTAAENQSGDLQGTSLDPDDIFGPVIQVPSEAFIELKPTRIYLDHPVRQKPPVAVWDFGNGIRVEVGTGRLVSPFAEQMGWVNRGTSAPKPAEMDSQDVINSSLESSRQYALSAGAPKEVIDRATNAFYAQVKSSGKASDGVNAFRSVIDAWERSEERKASRAQSDANTRAAREAHMNEVASRIEERMRDKIWKLREQKMIVEKLMRLKKKFDSGQWVPASDTQALIFEFNKLLDPKSVVRESEYERVAELGSLIDHFRGTLSKLKTGQVLANNVIASIFNTIQTLSSVYEDEYLAMATQLYRSAESNRSRGIPVQIEAVIPDYEDIKDKIKERLEGLRGRSDSGATPSSVPQQHSETPQSSQPPAVIPPSPFRNRQGGQAKPRNSSPVVPVRPIVGFGGSVPSGLVMI